jgi:hypothetical protein
MEGMINNINHELLRGSEPMPYDRYADNLTRQDELNEKMNKQYKQLAGGMDQLRYRQMQVGDLNEISKFNVSCDTRRSLS